MADSFGGLQGPVYGPDLPSTESDNQQERIAARRLRISARVEARKREELGEEDKQMEEATAEPRESLKQLEQSRENVLNLISYSKEILTNFSVAVDAKEANRRSKLKEECRLREEMLENEAKFRREKFEEIMKKRMEAKDTNTTLDDLSDALKGEQKVYAEISENKKKVIGELKREVGARDRRYVLNIKEMPEDMDLLIEKTQELVTSLKKLCGQELGKIEKAFEDEEKASHTRHMEEWEQKRKLIMDKQQEDLEQRMKQKEEYKEQLHDLRVKNENEFNTKRRNLQTQANMLQLNVERLNATKALNEVKSEYNRQVLGQCVMERGIIRPLQKKNIVRLNNTLKTLKKKCASQEKQSQEEEKALTDAYERSMQRYKDMQKRSRHFVTH